jgi:hypothetical protein
MECRVNLDPFWKVVTSHIGRADFGSRPSFLQGNRPTTITVLLFSVFISLQFKFSLHLNLNFVSIPTNSCNPIEYFCNIVVINFMFRL